MRAKRAPQDQLASERALSVTQAARYLGVRIGTLYAWIYREKIPAFKLRGRWKLSRTSLESIKGTRRKRK